MLNKMNLPNKLTMLRIILVPLFIICLSIPESFFESLEIDNGTTIMGWVALAIFVIAALTDCLDGRISRSQGIVTKFGKIMDPLADKLLVSAGFIMLTGLGVVPAYVTAIVVFRDFFVNALRMFGSDNSKDLAAGLSGKVKTLFQMLAITLALVSYTVSPTVSMFAFIENSLTMGTRELVINVAMSIAVLATLIATIWSFVRAIEAGSLPFTIFAFAFNTIIAVRVLYVVHINASYMNIAHMHQNHL